MYKTFLLLFTLLLSSNSSVFTEEKNCCLSKKSIVRRAAFDIGSGKVKLQVSDVDSETNEIVDILFMDASRVTLREDLAKSPNENLSSDIQNHLFLTLKQLKEKASIYKPIEYHAVGTESLRLAKNASALIERIKKELDLSITVISQEEEGILGFLSAVDQAKVNLKDAIVWDFGGGSFQITTIYNDKYIVYETKLGSIPFKEILIHRQGKDNKSILSPNPVSSEDFKLAMEDLKIKFKTIPDEIFEKLKNPGTVFLNVGINPLGKIGNPTDYSESQLLKEINLRLNSSDQFINTTITYEENRPDAPFAIVSNLILSYGLLQSLNVKNVRYAGTTSANAVGTLLTPKYWTKNLCK